MGTVQGTDLSFERRAFRYGVCDVVRAESSLHEHW